MASSSTKSSNKLRKRVEAESAPASSSSLKRAKDGSAFAKCEECHKDVPVALISFHSCSLDAKIKMNLDTTVVETPETKKKPSSAEKKTKKPSEPKPKKAVKKDGKKRPPTAFFVFMNDFRKTFKEENPDCKSVATVAKEGGVKWKAMSDEERKVYVDKAAELKSEYEKEASEEKDNAEEKEVEEIEVKEEDVETEDEKEVKEEKDDVMEEKEEVEDDE